MGQRNSAAARAAALVFGLILGALPAYAASAGGGYAGHRVVPGDFNGDGWTDFILQPLPGASGVGEFLGYSDGNFGAPLATWPEESRGSDWNADAHKILVGDFNGDGRDDLILQGAAGLASQEYLAAADGSFPQVTRTLPATLGGLDPSQASHALVVGDFNGDGRDDLLLQANTFVGTDAVALAGPDGAFTTLASSWGDGTLGLSWSADRAALTAGDFDGKGRAELLVRSTSAAGSDTCCRIVGFDGHMQPRQIRQSWAANWLGIDWSPATNHVIAADLNGNGRADLIVQPRAPGGEVYVLLAGKDGRFSTIADQWPSERSGVDWSAESYMLVPETAAPGKGATIAMVPEQAGLPYMRASFNTSGHLQGVTTLSSPPANALASATGSGPSAGGGASPMLAAATLQTNTTTNTTTADSVGAMAGSAGVTNGAAGYSIPIAVPPGRAGAAPKLTLSYASNGGDGHEGVGWSLGGLSAIYRCPATDASDGYTAGTQFKASDRLCLDGEKLMLSSGTYGAAGSVYHAEVNGFAEIVAHGQTTDSSGTDTGPAYFTVTATDGTRLYYGDTTDSKLVSPNGAVFTWALHESVDLNGNGVGYHYTIANGEYYPSSIGYTIGNGSPSASERKVVFKWEPRTSISGVTNIVHYLAGMKLQTTQLLTNIETYVGTTEVRDYALAYQKSPATNRPLLGSVQECAFDGSGEHCLKPATFTYQGQHAPVFAPADATELNISINPGACFKGGAGNSPFERSFDATGNGLVDQVASHLTGPVINGDITYTIQNGQFRQPGSATTYFAAPASLTSGLYFMDQPIDFNLDGRTDFMLGDPGNGNEINFTYTTDGGASWQQQDAGIQMPAGTPIPYTIKDNGLKPIVEGDVNGDGRPDLILSWHDDTGGGNGTFYIRPYFERPLGDTPLYTASSYTLSSTKVITSEQVFDYNADGKSDLLIHFKGDAYYTLLLSTGSGFNEIQTNIPAFTRPTNSNLTVPVYLVDVNGDSLPDAVEGEKVNGAWHWVVYPNEGTPDGQFGAMIDTGIAVASTTNDGESGATTKFYLYDFVQVLHDPSGRNDLLMPTARTLYSPLANICIHPTDGGPLQCGRPFTIGSCSGYDVRTDLAPESRDTYDWELYRADGGFGLSDFGQIAANLGPPSILDYNHDGIPDVSGVAIAVSPSTVSRALKAYQFSFAGGATDGVGPMPDLMASSKNGFGITHNFSYQPIANPSVYMRAPNGSTTYPNMLFQSTMQVVSKMTVSNPVDGTNAYTYFYKDARYNVAGRGFLGFGEIDVIDASRSPEIETETTYDQDFPFIGRVASTKTSTYANRKSATNWFSQTQTTWQSAKPAGANYPVVYAEKQVSTTKDPNSYAVTETDTTQESSQPDACGKPPGSTETITTDQASETTDTTNTWNGGDPDACWQDTLHEQDVSTTRNYTQQPTTTDTLATSVTYGYDGKEQVTSKDVSTTHNGYNDTRNWSYGYDTYGNRTSVKQSADGTSRETTSDYGVYDDYNAYGYFPVTVTNPLGQSAHFTYDNTTGNKLKATDANGCITSFAYDAFGRPAGGVPCGESAVVITRIDPGGTFGSGGYTAVCPAHAAYVKTRTQAGYPASYTCYDALGDKLRAASEGFSTGDWIYVDTTYDRFARVLTQTVPHYSTVTSPPETQYTSYDVLDRPTVEVMPTSGGGARTVTMTYTGLEIGYKDEDDITRVTHYYNRYYDGLGKGNGNLVQVDQTETDGTINKATYRYDAGGNLIQATDPEGNAITATYDGFGDKRTLSDPDKGNWSYTYDGYGEQKTVTDAMKHTITTDYDALGRKTSETDPADSNRVTAWHYDSAPYGIGKLAYETVTVNGSQTYKRYYGYDSAGRSTASEVVTGGKTYMTSAGYDDYGRPQTQIYPAMNGGADQPPTVSASASPSGPVATGTSVNLIASASDPDSASLSYQWTQTSGPAVTIDAADTARAAVSLVQAGTYGFRVSVSDGLLSRTASVTVQAESLPTASVTPTLNPTTSYTGGFSVTWSAVPNATSYQLQETEVGAGTTTPYNGGATSYAATGRGAGTYQYQVRGCDDVGCGPWGGTATETVVAPPPPQAPLLSPNPSPTGAWTVQWGSVSGADTYTLQEKAGSSWITKQNTSALSWSTSGRADGTYYYRVKSCNTTTGCGGWSATATETVLMPPAGAPAVTPLFQSVTMGSSYTLNWNAVTGATSYSLEANGGTPSSLGNVTSITRTATSKPQPYTLTYEVEACNAAGCGPWSNTATVNVNPSTTCLNPPCLALATTGLANGNTSTASTGVSGTGPNGTISPDTVSSGGTGRSRSRPATTPRAIPTNLRASPTRRCMRPLPRWMPGGMRQR